MLTKYLLEIIRLQSTLNIKTYGIEWIFQYNRKNNIDFMLNATLAHLKLLDAFTKVNNKRSVDIHLFTLHSVCIFSNIISEYVTSEVFNYCLVNNITKTKKEILEETLDNIIFDIKELEDIVSPIIESFDVTDEQIYDFTIKFISSSSNIRVILITFLILIGLVYKRYNIRLEQVILLYLSKHLLKAIRKDKIDYYVCSINDTKFVANIINNIDSINIDYYTILNTIGNSYNKLISNEYDKSLLDELDIFMGYDILERLEDL